MGQREKTLAHFFSATLDLILNFVSVLAALLVLRYALDVSIGGTTVAISVAIAFLSIAIYFVFDLYSIKVFAPLHTQLIKLGVVQLIIASALFVFIAIFADNKNYYIAELIAISLSAFFIAIKLIISTKLIHAVGKRRRLKKVIVVGSSQAGKDYITEVNNNKHLGYMVIGTVASKRQNVPNKLGSYYELEAIIKREHPYEIVLALSSREQHQLQNIISVADKCGVRAIIIPTATYKYFKSKCQVDMIGNLPIINTRAVPLDNLANAAMKRIMDVVISLIIILLLFGWGRNGFGGNGGNFGGSDNGYCGFGAPNIYGKLDGITYGISDATFALNNNITSGFNNVQSTLCQGFAGVNNGLTVNGYETRGAITDLGYRLQDCCCKTQQAIADCLH